MLKPSLKKIAFAGPWTTDLEADYAADAARNGFYESFNSYIVKVEEAMRQYVGRRFAIATNNCTAALHLSTAAIGLGPGDEVICTDTSWVATAYVISYTGATPVFVDISPDTWTIDPDAITAAITPKTKAIMLVHTYGQPANMTRIMAIAQQYGLHVIEDAAPALGVEHEGRKAGSFGTTGCFSFHGAKLTVAGEGGMFLTDDEATFTRARKLSRMGRNDEKGFYWSDHLGWKYAMANVVAAVALAQVQRVEELVKRKRTIFGWYKKRLATVNGLQLICEPPGSRANYCYPSVLIDPKLGMNRDHLRDKLEVLNIHCRPAHPRMSTFPAFTARFSNPVAESVENHGLSLPSAANITEEDVDFTCNALLELCRLT